LLLLQEKLVQNVLDIDGTDVFKRVDFWGEAVITHRLVEFGNHFPDAVHRCRRGLHDQRVASAIGHHAHLFCCVRSGRGRKEVVRVAGGIVLLFVEVLHLFGDFLGLGVLERKRLHDLFLRFFRVERGHQFLDRLEVRFARKYD